MAGKMQGLKVDIYDNTYYLRSDASSDDEYTKDLAKAVDAAMRTIADKTHTYDSLRLAVLAALHFADECEQVRERYERLSESVSEKSAELGDALDQILKKES